MTKINLLLDQIFPVAVILAILSTLFLFGNFTTDMYDTPKLMALTILTSLILIILGVKYLLQGKVAVTLTPLHLPLLVILVVAAISTYLCPAPLISLLGNNSKVNGSLVSLVVYSLFYFCIVSGVRDMREVRVIINTLLAGGAVLAGLTLAAILGLHLWPSPLAPTGSSFSTMAVMLILLPISLIFSFSSHHHFKIIYLLLASLFVSTIILSWLKGPKEVTLDFVTSWQVAISSFRDHPYVGSGPSTFSFNFTAYKPVEFNHSPYWQLKFDHPANEFLLFLSNLGGLGLLGLILLLALFLKVALPVLSLPRRWQSINSPEHQLTTGLALSGTIFWLLLALHFATVVVWVMGLLVLGLLMISSHHTKTISFSSKTTPVILLLLLTLSVTLGGAWLGRFFLSDYHHRLALKAIGQNDARLTYQELLIAETLSPNYDLYRANLAQTNLALASGLASLKQASPSGSLTEADKQHIKILLSQAISEAQAATALSPRNATNWQILGIVYQQLTSVTPEAAQFALDAYGRAIQRDGANPNLRLNVARIYYFIKNYDLAIKFFHDAITLKPDFANAYYNLSITYRDKGDNATAINLAKKLLSLLDPKSADYQLASDYLASLQSNQNTSDGGTKSLLGGEAELTSPNLPQIPPEATPSAQ